VESLIDELAAQGRRYVLLAPVGFVCDHVEILYDIDVVFREYGRTRGVSVHRTASLNDSPLFIQALAAVVRERVSGRFSSPLPAGEGGPRRRFHQPGRDG
jgi:ferrochelatase